MQITNEVFQVGGGGFTSQEDGAAYLIKTGGHAALIDAGCGNTHKRLVKNIEGLGVGPSDLELLLLTHCHFDHTGGAAAVRDTFHCRILAHELDAFYLGEGDNGVTAASWYGQSLDPLAVDEAFTGPETVIHLGKKPIRALHMPGHSPGSVVYLMESEGLTVLFGQDVHGPLHPGLLSDTAAYRDSLEQLLSLKADILCEGHFGIYKGRAEVARFISGYLS